MDFGPALPRRLESDLAAAAAAVRGARDAIVVAHIDADGISAGAIASITLDRLGIGHEVLFEKKISEEALGRINGSGAEVAWICDLGSAYLSGIERGGAVVTDHHVPDPAWRREQTVLDDFSRLHHLNPHEYGSSGSYDACGACMTYLLSRAIDPRNADLAYLAVVGAVGDVQDERDGKLAGYNRVALADAVAAGDVEASEDIVYYGRDTRPLIQFLRYGDSPAAPGITGDPDGAQRFFADLGIPLRDERGWRTWNDLDAGDKKRAAAYLSTFAPEGARLLGEAYSLTRFEPRSGLRDAKEFATALNACGRYGDAAIGLGICRGNRDAMRDAERLRADHRRGISSAIDLVKKGGLVRRRGSVQYFDAGSDIRETVVGIVAGMLLGSGGADGSLPLFAFAEADDGVKVSARASRALTDAGLDLAGIVKSAAESVGGYGGGHRVAAGATIPRGREEDFLDAAEALVSSGLT
jgi:RecJ-like exonuclease